MPETLVYRFSMASSFGSLTYPTYLLLVLWAAQSLCPSYSQSTLSASQEQVGCFALEHVLPGLRPALTFHRLLELSEQAHSFWM